MNTQEFASIQHSTHSLETSLKVMEEFLEQTNSRPLFQATLSLLQALRHVHEVEPALLGEECRARIEFEIGKDKQKSGRDSFNTGF